MKTRPRSKRPVVPVLGRWMLVWVVFAAGAEPATAQHAGPALWTAGMRDSQPFATGAYAHQAHAESRRPAQIGRMAGRRESSTDAAIGWGLLGGAAGAAAGFGGYLLSGGEVENALFVALLGESIGVPLGVWRGSSLDGDPTLPITVSLATALLGLIAMGNPAPALLALPPLQIYTSIRLLRVTDW